MTFVFFNQSRKLILKLLRPDPRMPNHWSSLVWEMDIVLSSASPHVPHFWPSSRQVALCWLAQLMDVNSKTGSPLTTSHLKSCRRGSLKCTINLSRPSGCSQDEDPKNIDETPPLPDRDFVRKVAADSEEHPSLLQAWHSGWCPAHDSQLSPAADSRVELSSLPQLLKAGASSAELRLSL
jgi:hypothetical protein